MPSIVRDVTVLPQSLLARSLLTTLRLFTVEPSHVTVVAHAPCAIMSRAANMNRNFFFLIVYFFTFTLIF